MRKSLLALAFLSLGLTSCASSSDEEFVNNQSDLCKAGSNASTCIVLSKKSDKEKEKFIKDIIAGEEYNVTSTITIITDLFTAIIKKSLSDGECKSNGTFESNVETKKVSIDGHDLILNQTANITYSGIPCNIKKMNFLQLTSLILNGLTINLSGTVNQTWLDNGKKEYMSSTLSIPNIQVKLKSSGFDKETLLKNLRVSITGSSNTRLMKCDNNLTSFIHNLNIVLQPNLSSFDDLSEITALKAAKVNGSFEYKITGEIYNLGDLNCTNDVLDKDLTGNLHLTKESGSNDITLKVTNNLLEKPFEKTFKLSDLNH